MIVLKQGEKYNAPLHVLDKSQKDLRQTFYSRLQNNTIKAMITKVRDLYNKQLDNKLKGDENFN